MGVGHITIPCAADFDSYAAQNAKSEAGNKVFQPRNGEARKME
jgi:hypothetical protein